MPQQRGPEHRSCTREAYDDQPEPAVGAETPSAPQRLPPSESGVPEDSAPEDSAAHDSAFPNSSRNSRFAAGWECTEPGTFERLLPPGIRTFSWLSPIPILKSRNDVLAKLLGDPTNEQRRRWVAERRAAGVDPELTVRTYAERARVSFLVLGDSGEGDASQYCTVPGLLAQSGDTAFMAIASDVVYPSGDTEDYENRFYRPYRDYPGPIFGVPGNHDWYDGLNGFMRNLCGVDFRPAGAGPAGSAGPALDSASRSRLAGAALRLLWRRAPGIDQRALDRMRALRGRREQQPQQPGPYFAVEAGPVLLVGIDTGITGEIDRDQAAWLEHVSRASPKPKILLTGTPLYADARRVPVRIEGLRMTVNDIVAAPEYGYVAAIGGDRHNYQRYPVRHGDGRTIQYIVSGGGGAFLHDTHLIPRVDLPGVGERDFRCYPLRGDSLSMFSQTYRDRLGRLVGDVYIPPEQAAALVAEQTGDPPVRVEDREVAVTEETRRAYRTISRLPKRLPEPLHEYVQRFFDRDDPPLFKSFLRVDAGPEEITLRCFAATGCREHELTPPLEDTIRCTRDRDGNWNWVSGRADPA